MSRSPFEGFDRTFAIALCNDTHAAPLVRRDVIHVPQHVYDAIVAAFRPRDPVLPLREQLLQLFEHHRHHSAVIDVGEPGPKYDSASNARRAKLERP